MKLTKRAIDSFKYEGTDNSRDVRWDDELPGFGIRLYPSGKKAFVLSYRVSGRKRMLTIGRYGVFTLEMARKKANKHLVGITEQIDPLEDRERIAKGETVKDLCLTYMERHAKPRKKTWIDDQQRIDKYILPAWGTRKVFGVKRSDMATMHSNLGKNDHPYGANRLLRLVSKMYSLARQWGYVPDDYPNPARDIELFKEHKRDRWVSEEELPLLMESVNDIPNIYARDALWLYLLTGVRRAELLTAKWEQIDWKRKELRLTDTKAGRTHYIPLSAPALKILEGLPIIENNPYVLPGMKKGQHLVNIDKPWRKVKIEASIKYWKANHKQEYNKLISQFYEKYGREPSLKEVKAAARTALPPAMLDIRLHDLRRTVGSWMAQAGNSLHLIGRVLNHSNQSTTAIYARFGESQVRTALEQHGKQIMGVANKKASNVVKIKS